MVMLTELLDNVEMKNVGFSFVEHMRVMRRGPFRNK